MKEGDRLDAGGTATAPADSGEKSKARGNRLFERGLVLTAELVLLNFWLVRHLGTGLENSELLTGAVTLITGVFGFMAWMGGKSQDETAAARFHGWFTRVFSFPLLVIVGAAIVTLLLVTSSVVVLNNFGETPARVRLARADQASSANSQQQKSTKNLAEAIKEAHCSTSRSEGEESAEDNSNAAPGSITELARSKEDPYRYLVTTSPFGTPYRVEAKGYLPKTLDVFPLWGVTVDPERDLRAAPSVLFRPDSDALGALDDGGYIVITLLRDGKQQLIACGAKTRSSFLIGRMEFLSATLVQAFRDDWTLELKGGSEDETHTAQTLLQWRYPRRLPLFGIPDLQPQMRLEAEVYSRTGTPVARAKTTVSEEALTDVRIPYIEKQKAQPAAQPLSGNP